MHRTHSYLRLVLLIGLLCAACSNSDAPPPETTTGADAQVTIENAPVPENPSPPPPLPLPPPPPPPGPSTNQTDPPATATGSSATATTAPSANEVSEDPEADGNADVDTTGDDTAAAAGDATDDVGTDVAEAAPSSPDTPPTPATPAADTGSAAGGDTGSDDSAAASDATGDAAGIAPGTPDTPPTPATPADTGSAAGGDTGSDDSAAASDAPGDAAGAAPGTPDTPPTPDTPADTESAAGGDAESSDDSAAADDTTGDAGTDAAGDDDGPAAPVPSGTIPLGAVLGAANGVNGNVAGGNIATASPAATSPLPSATPAVGDTNDDVGSDTTAAADDDVAGNDDGAAGSSGGSAGNAGQSGTGGLAPGLTPAGPGLSLVPKITVQAMTPMARRLPKKPFVRANRSESSADVADNGTSGETEPVPVETNDDAAAGEEDDPVLAALAAAASAIGKAGSGVGKSLNADPDGDGIGNIDDTCPLVANPGDQQSAGCPPYTKAKTIAGKPGGAGRAGGLGSASRLRRPRLMAKSDTHLFVADGKTIFRAPLSTGQNPLELDVLTTMESGEIRGLVIHGTALKIFMENGDLWAWPLSGQYSVPVKVTDLLPSGGTIGAAIAAMNALYVVTSSMNHDDVLSVVGQFNTQLIKIMDLAGLYSIDGMAYSDFTKQFYFVDYVGEDPDTLPKIVLEEMPGSIWALKQGDLTQLKFPASLITQPSSISITPDGKKALVTGLDVGKILVIDLEHNNTGTTLFDGIVKPRGILAMGPASNSFYLADDTTIRRALGSTLKTVAGAPLHQGSAHGSGEQARFSKLEQIAVISAAGMTTQAYVVDQQCVSTAGCAQVLRRIKVPAAMDAAASVTSDTLPLKDPVTNKPLVVTDIAVTPSAIKKMLEFEPMVFAVTQEGTLYHLSISPPKVTKIILPRLYVDHLWENTTGHPGEDHSSLAVHGGHQPHSSGKCSKEGYQCWSEEYEQQLGRCIAFDANGRLWSVRAKRNLNNLSKPGATSLGIPDSIVRIDGLKGIDFKTVQASQYDTAANPLITLYDTLEDSYAMSNNDEWSVRGSIEEDFALDSVTATVVVAARWQASGKGAPLGNSTYDAAPTGSPVGLYALTVTSYDNPYKELRVKAKQVDGPIGPEFVSSMTALDGYVYGAVSGGAPDTYRIGRLPLPENPSTTTDIAPLSGSAEEGVKDGEGVLGGWNRPVDLAYDSLHHRFLVIDQDENVVRILH